MNLMLFFKPQFIAELIAINFVSFHPVIGVLTNLVDRFIVGRIRKLNNDANSRFNYVIETLDTNSINATNEDDEENLKFASKRPIEYAFLVIIEWLWRCSGNKDFEASTYATKSFFQPYIEAQNYLVNIFDTESSNKSSLIDDVRVEISVVNNIFEKRDLLVSRLIPEIRAFLEPVEDEEIEIRRGLPELD